MSRGVLVYNKSYCDGAVKELISSFCGAFRARGVALDTVAGVTVGYGEEGLSLAPLYADFVLFYDKDVKSAYALEAAGYRVFNRASAIETCDDKQKTYAVLAGCAPLVKTYAAPLVYERPDARIDKAFLDFIESVLGYPIVVKSSSGSLGAQVSVARKRSELNRISKRLLCKPHIYQQFVECGGSDLRVYVVGGKAAGILERVCAAGSYKTNAGYASVCALADSPEAEAYAVNCAEKLGLDFCAVDFLRGRESLLVCEVNSNPYFKNISALGVDMSGMIAEYVLQMTDNK
ncbi:MAG: hypothetical protein FWE62_04395 [Firmicutes bacterium]|nr:hypothetical protein [Bacillota bacterium]